MLATMVLSAITNAATQNNFALLFKPYHGCFILYHLNKHRIVEEYNPHHQCDLRISPDSTFKIPLSLMAFDQGIINQHTIFKWDGKMEDLPGWNQDQTPETWLQYSVIWVSRQITHQLGAACIKKYLAAFAYGNQDFSGDPGKNNGLTHAWLSSSLKISAVEQLHFLQTMLTNELPVSSDAVVYTKKNLFLGKLLNGASYYGKTGSGRHGQNERQAHSSRLRDGWFVGYVEKGNQQYIFVSNLTDKFPTATENNGVLKPYGSQLLKPITIQLLNDYFLNRYTDNLSSS